MNFVTLKEWNRKNSWELFLLTIFAFQKPNKDTRRETKGKEREKKKRKKNRTLVNSTNFLDFSMPSNLMWL